ncbi:uncharacterized protein VTP21DRAFT_1331 [Calcarisporiella thermophila]|uniref:uncharacterized protein n=1 Tax=Calcarisporiella thermophila TaxID=911321 RepID=UPI0037437CE2
MDFIIDYRHVLITAAVLIVTTLLLVIISRWTSSRVARDAVLLAGLSESGKTGLFMKLRFGEIPETHTSLKENVAVVELKFADGTPVTKKPIRLVDIPGHERLRFKLNEFIPFARGVVFVIDSSTVARSIRDIAEYLYDILANEHVQKHRIPVLVACNKADLLTGVKKERIQEMLEAEMDRLRHTRTASLLDQQESDAMPGDRYLGFEDQPFRFEHLTTEVRFERCSVMKEVDSILEFVSELA